MGIYSNEMKQKCSKVVLIIGVVAGICGVLTLAFGAMQMGAGKEYTSDYGSFDVQGGFAIGTIAAGILCIVTGVLGCLTGKFKKPFFTIPFIVLAILIAIFLFVAAAVMGGGEDQLKELVDEGCNKQIKELDNKSTRELLKGNYENLVDLNMCSDNCPCPEEVESTWESVSSSRLSEAGRSNSNG